MKKIFIISVIAALAIIAAVVFYQSGGEKPVASVPAAEVNLPATSGVAQTPVLPPAASPAQPPQAQVAEPQPKPKVSAQSVVITYSDSGFSPNSVTINKGDKVVFKNESSAPFWPASNVHPTHALYDGTSLSGHCANPTNDTFDACGGIAAGGSWPFTFNKIGSWTYHDHLNPNYGGTVVVK